MSNAVDYVSLWAGGSFGWKDLENRYYLILQSNRSNHYDIMVLQSEGKLRGRIDYPLEEVPDPRVRCQTVRGYNVKGDSKVIRGCS